MRRRVLIGRSDEEVKEYQLLQSVELEEESTDILEQNISGMTQLMILLEFLPQNSIQLDFDIGDLRVFLVNGATNESGSRYIEVRIEKISDRVLVEYSSLSGNSNSNYGNVNRAYLRAIPSFDKLKITSNNINNKFVAGTKAYVYGR